MVVTMLYSYCHGIWLVPRFTFFENMLFFVFVYFCAEDYLQAPLQPLMDNLESQTYEAFEKDPVKYAQYEKAIVKALELQTEGDTTVLMVSFAGFLSTASSASLPC